MPPTVLADSHEAGNCLSGGGVERILISAAGPEPSQNVDVTNLAVLDRGSMTNPPSPRKVPSTCHRNHTGRKPSKSVDPPLLLQFFACDFGGAHHGCPSL
jgi:hypothetical protein